MPTKAISRIIVLIVALAALTIAYAMDRSHPRVRPTTSQH